MFDTPPSGCLTPRKNLYTNRNNTFIRRGSSSPHIYYQPLETRDSDDVGGPGAVEGFSHLGRDSALDANEDPLKK